ncbi:hypothetical protein [Phocoenobacter skyensis]|uniref:hypothetical protein n=1 Tax=Phocoenobacter skyensis TaxID=97481 RepID=UPI00275A0CA0|nr:hypothetical protein [Pasteurella skyensis]MDP8185313.1 hypothetical protein [Pasteurella skyensis]
MNNNEINLLDLPDIYLNFDETFGVSCGLSNGDELLQYFMPFLTDWSENNYSTHQFAQKYAEKGISLWAEKGQLFTDEDKKECSFLIRFTGQYEGYVITHCTYEKRGLLQ